MAGLVPAIHALIYAKQGVNARHRPGMTLRNWCKKIENRSA
jgi:hypothetical protein